MGVLWNSAQRLITKEMCRLADIIIQEKFFKKECLGQLRFEKMVLGMGSYVIKNVLCLFEITCSVALSFLKTISCLV